MSINLAAAKKLKKMREAMLKTMKTRENSREHEPAEANKTEKTKKQRQNLKNSSQRSTALLKLTRTKRREKNCSKTLCSSRVSLWPPGFVHPCSEHGYARVHACIICTYAYMYRRRERDTRYESATNHRTVFCVVPLWSLPPSCPSMNQNRHNEKPVLETS